ncbi:MAG: hypothetical protein RBS55_05630 [Bacteroidales bacterium]|jgi:mRNA interferase RelE/StbE|nr:hypothetical protein [Bacteroidales bacterium]
MKTAFKNSFYKSVLKIKNPAIRLDIAETIAKVEAVNDPKEIPQLRKLHGSGKYYRIKLGEYRIGLKLVKDTMFFVVIDHRKDIYKHFP